MVLHTSCQILDSAVPVILDVSHASMMEKVPPSAYNVHQIITCLKENTVSNV